MDEDKIELAWRQFQEIMGYSDEQLAKFRSNPKFVKVLATRSSRTYKIIAEVIQSNGCVCRHSVGQRFVMNSNGALVSGECPETMCLFLVSQFTAAVAAIYERVIAGLDPNDLMFNTVSCTDVGVECGGWGRVLVKIRVEDPGKSEAR